MEGVTGGIQGCVTVWPGEFREIAAHRAYKDYRKDYVLLGLSSSGVGRLSAPSSQGARRGTAGGLLIGLNWTRRLSVFRSGQSKCRAAGLVPDGGPYRVKHMCSG